MDAGFHTADTCHFIQNAKEGTSLTLKTYPMQEMYWLTCREEIFARFHFKFLWADSDLCKWRHSAKIRMLSFYINIILYAEIHKKIAYIPQVVLLSIDATRRLCCADRYCIRSPCIDEKKGRSLPRKPPQSSYVPTK